MTEKFLLKDVKTAVPLKYLNNFCRTLNMSLINCETNLSLAWSENYFVSSATGKPKFAITDTNILCRNRNFMEE